MTKQGLAAIVATKGNPHCHLILRGGETGPNYSEDEHRRCALGACKKRGFALR